VSDAFADDPELRDAAARARHDWRVEQEETARDAYVAWRHTRTLDDVLRECMARGDRVEVHVHGHAFRGVIVDLAPDLVSLRDDEGRPRVDVRRSADVPLAVRLVARAVTHGRRGGGEDGDFRGRLHAREDGDDACCVYVVGEREPRRGRVAPGDGCVVITHDDGTETWCALAAVVAVTTAPEDA
jgi:hypothetical protein